MEMGTEHGNVHKYLKIHGHKFEPVSSSNCLGTTSGLPRKEQVKERIFKRNQS